MRGFLLRKQDSEHGRGCFGISASPLMVSVNPRITGLGGSSGDHSGHREMIAFFS